MLLPYTSLDIPNLKPRAYVFFGGNTVRSDDQPDLRMSRAFDSRMSTSRSNKGRVFRH